MNIGEQTYAAMLKDAENSHAEISRLRAALATARAEVERLTTRADVAEAGWRGAVAERDQQARLRKIAEEAIPKGLAVGMDYARAEGFRAGIEAAAKEMDARRQSLAVASDRAQAAGRENVAMVRESEAQLLEDLATRIRSLLPIPADDKETDK